MAMSESRQVGIASDHYKDHSGRGVILGVLSLAGRRDGGGVTGEFDGGTVSWCNDCIATFKRLDWSISERRPSTPSGGAHSSSHRPFIARPGASQAKFSADCDQSPGEDSARRSRGCDRCRSQRELHSVAANLRLTPAAGIHLNDRGEADSARVSANPSIGVGERGRRRRNPALAHGRVRAPHQGRKRVHRHPHLQEESATAGAVLDRYGRFRCRIDIHNGIVLRVIFQLAVVAVGERV
jgi:hypothetical protein